MAPPYYLLIKRKIMEIFDFNKISYPKETAYFIGFVWADGSINRNNYVVIEINKDDALNLFNIFLKVCDFKYSERQRVKRKPQSKFFFNNKEMAQFFIKNGKYSNTVESHKKILKYIPDEYKIYFLRGLIDGDGCFYAQKPNKKWRNNAPQFTIAGRYEQDWDALPLDWQLGLLLGIFLGALGTAALSGGYKPRISEGEGSVYRRLAVTPVQGIIGGFLVMTGIQLSGDSVFGQFAAGIQLSGGAWVFLIAMAVSAILLACLLAQRGSSGAAKSKSSGGRAEKSAKKKGGK